MRSATAKLLRWLAVLLLTALAVTAVHRFYGRPALGVDDANMFFTYADHLAHGQGLVYNVGGERVEGFTSFLWTLFCAAVFRLAASPERIVLALSVVLFALTHVVLLRGLRRAVAPAAAWPYEALYLLLVFSSPAYVLWTTITLMDTCLWGTLLALATYACLAPSSSRPGHAALAALAALMVMARPESMVVVPLFVVLWGLRQWEAGAGRRALGAGALYAAVFAATLAGLTVFRMAYFGVPLPNTYYAKVSPALAYNVFHGLSYARSYLQSSAIASIAVAVALVVVVWRVVTLLRPARGSAARAPGFSPFEAVAWVSAGLLVVPVVTGGDHFMLFRFYQPAYPVFCLTLVLGAARLGLADRARAALGRLHGAAAPVMALAVLSLGAVWVFDFDQQPTWLGLLKAQPMRHEFRIADRGVRRGAGFAELFSREPRLPSIGVIAAGGIKRTYPGTIIDLMGLNNTLVAHSKGDRRGVRSHAAFQKPLFYELDPDILVLDPEGPAPLDGFENLVLKGLLGDREFNDRYVFADVRKAGWGPGHGRGYFKCAFLEALRQRGLYEIVTFEAPPAGA